MVRSDKSEAEIEADEAIDTFDELVRQRDALRAENERLRTSNEAWKVQLERESARNERLRVDQELLDESVRNQAIREAIHKDELKRLRGEIETWGQIWNDAELLAARVEALRDGTAQT